MSASTNDRYDRRQDPSRSVPRSSKSDEKQNSLMKAFEAAKNKKSKKGRDEVSASKMEKERYYARMKLLFWIFCILGYTGWVAGVMHGLTDGNYMFRGVLGTILCIGGLFFMLIAPISSAVMKPECSIRQSGLLQASSCLIVIMLSVFGVAVYHMYM